MRLQRKLTNKEWKEVVALGPGVHIFRGKKTLIYNGEKLFDREKDLLVYNEEERNSWQVIIVIPGVEIIPEGTFAICENVKTVIMADSVQRIEMCAFANCNSLVYLRLSRNLEFISRGAFYDCKGLTSIFVPPSCREIEYGAFYGSDKLIIFHVPQHTLLGDEVNVIMHTALLEVSPLAIRPPVHEHADSDYRELPNTNEYNMSEEFYQWIKDVNMDEEFELHLECASFEPSEDNIYNVLKKKGLSSFKEKNDIGITASRYLEENPFSEIDEQKLVNKFVLELMGEVIIEMHN